MGHDSAGAFLPLAAAVIFCYTVTACVVLAGCKKGQGLAEDLDTSCVVGDDFILQNWNGSLVFPPRLVSRDDGGFLYGKQIAGPFASDDEVREMIASQSTKLSSWTLDATDGVLGVDPDIGNKTVWQYPVQVNGVRISITGRLPEGSRDEAYAAFILQNRDYCDTDAAQGNVWYESRDWMPEAGIMIGTSGAVLGGSLAILAFILYVFQTIDGNKVKGRVTDICLVPCWCALFVSIVAFMWIGGLGITAGLPAFSGSNWWAVNLLRLSPQSKVPFISGCLCYFSYFVIALVMAAGYLVITCADGCAMVSVSSKALDEWQKSHAALKKEGLQEVTRNSAAAQPPDIQWDSNPVSAELQEHDHGGHGDSSA